MDHCERCGYELVDVVAPQIGTCGSRMRSSSRHRKHVEKRNQIARYLRFLGWTMVDIAFALNRDHSTVVYMLGQTRREAR